ncbi:MAG TPA: cytochrome c biogenesis protein CcdA [Anaerolineaceae bacterium]|nr:cytochrome c biogenesis protein CcdA [Anaerolineaceae bacterium]
MNDNLTIGLAFITGLASFLSPCVLALVPAYIGYLSGRSLGTIEKSQGRLRLETFFHGLAFVLGFSLVFVLMGLTASAIGSLLLEIRPWLAKIGGLLVIFFGLHMTGILRLPFLEYDLRPQNRQDQQRGLFSSFIMGILFSAGWSPCTGPILGGILMLAMNSANLGKGALLLIAYSAGLAIPFLAAAFGVGWVSQLLKRYQKLTHTIEVAMGILLIVIGFMLVLGIFQLLSQFAPIIDIPL